MVAMRADMAAFQRQVMIIFAGFIVGLLGLFGALVAKL
jgi:hypothetical protein